MGNSTASHLPNLVIVGVAKGGTTSLFHYLSQHEDICPSDIKEIDYFSPLRRQDGDTPPVEAYSRHFDHCKDHPYRMEASPSYCYGGEPVIRAVRDILGSPRILVSLRDPVSRFWSAFTFLKSMGRIDSDLTCDAYIDQCLAAEGHTPLSVGRYTEWLPLWLDEFGDRCEVVFAEQLSAEPLNVVNQVANWLGLDHLAEIDVTRHNPTAVPRSHLVARLAYSVKQASDKMLASLPSVRAVMRTAYKRLNTSGAYEPMDRTVENRLALLYAESTAKLAPILASHGVSDTPDWLAVHK